MLTVALAAVCVAPWTMYSYAAGGAALSARIGENLSNQRMRTRRARVGEDAFLLIVFGGVLAVGVGFTRRPACSRLARSC